MASQKLLFLGWAPHGRRSQLMAQQLGGKLCFVHHLRFKRPWYAPAKYVLQAIDTLKLLMRERPDVIFVQNPPIFCVHMAALYCQQTEAVYVIDSHTGAFLSPRWRWALPLHRQLSRRALSTLVTNEYLSRQVVSWGAPSLVIRDVPATFGPGRPFPVDGDFVVTVSNSFSWDEPLEEVLEAAAGLSDISFYITGNPQAMERRFRLDPPPNVRLTGFLDDDDYIGLMRASNAVMALTTKDHTMQRGACEALALGKPIITSNWQVLKEYFSGGTIHVESSARAIREGILDMRSRWKRLAADIVELRADREKEWQEKKGILKALLDAG